MNTTVELLQRARQGERHALNDLYARYWERMHAVVRLRLGPALRAKMESSDIVQEVFLASTQDLERFEYRSEGDFFHWLCRLVENRIRDQADYFQAAKRDAAREVPLQRRLPSRTTILGPLAGETATSTPSTAAIREEELALLERAIDELPDDQREAVILSRYEGLSFPDAGAIMGRTPDATRMLVSRALVALSKTLRRLEL